MKKSLSLFVVLLTLLLLAAISDNKIAKESNKIASVELKTN